jgi:outer membrane lipoprotein
MRVSSRFCLSLPLFLFIPVLFPLLSGCAPISKELRTKTDQTLTFQQIFDNPEAYQGKMVIWGGEIIRTLNQKDKTTLIEVLQRPLGWREEPKRTDASGGRFLILAEGFLDPHLYRRGRAITVAGEILGEKMRFLGEIEYRYPLLLSKQIHLWREHYRRYPSPYFPEYPWGDYANAGSLVVKLFVQEEHCLFISTNLHSFAPKG